MIDVLNLVTHQLECQKCGSTLRYSYKDVESESKLEKVSPDDKWQSAVLYHHIVCPVCKRQIAVDDPNLEKGDVEKNDVEKDDD